MENNKTPLNFIIPQSIDLVQACIDRCLNVPSLVWTIRREETRSTTKIFFSDERLGELGSIELSTLPDRKTEIYKWGPTHPSSDWTMDYLINKIGLPNVSKNLATLLKAHAVQTETSFNALTSQQLYEISNKSNEDNSKSQELTLDEVHEANKELGEWRQKIFQLRESEYKEIIEYVLGSLHKADLQSENLSNLIETKLVAVEPEVNEFSLGNSEPVSHIMDETTVIVNQACIEWANRGYKIPRITMEEFLDDIYIKHDVFLSKDQFKAALKKAGERGLIKKERGRWRPK